MLNLERPNLHQNVQISTESKSQLNLNFTNHTLTALQWDLVPSVLWPYRWNWFQMTHKLGYKWFYNTYPHVSYSSSPFQFPVTYILVPPHHHDTKEQGTPPVIDGGGDEDHDEWWLGSWWWWWWLWSWWWWRWWWWWWLGSWKMMMVMMMNHNDQYITTSPWEGGVRSQGRNARCPATPITYSVSSAEIFNLKSKYFIIYQLLILIQLEIQVLKYLIQFQNIS